MSDIIEMPYVRIKEDVLEIPCLPKCSHCQLERVISLLDKLLERTAPYHTGSQVVKVDPPSPPSLPSSVPVVEAKGEE